MGRFMQRVAREWRRVRVALVVLALGSAVWTVVLRLTAGQGVAPGDWVEATAGLAIAVAAVALPLASLAGDRRLARLASRRGGRLPRWPILAPKWLACFGAWLALSVGASAFSLLWLPSWECLTEWVGMLDAGWLWVVVGFGGAFFASAATGQLRAAIPLALLLGILPPFLMRYPFDLSLSEGGGHGTKALAGALATLWLLAAAALAFPARFAAPAGAWARALARLRTGVCVGLAVLCAASVVPLILVVPSLLLGPGDATAVSEPRLSPDGRFVAFVVHFKAWPLHPCSCYVLNTESGQAWRLSRFQQSALRFPGECDWSPGGRCLAYCVYPGPLREARLRLAGADVGHAEDLGIFDTLTGEAREVRHPAIHYGSRIRWKEEGVIGVESEDWSAGGRIFQTWGATGEFRCVVATGTIERVGPAKGTIVQEAPTSDGAPREWRLARDPKGRGFALVFRDATEPGALGGAFYLVTAQDAVGSRLGRIDEPIGELRHCCMFSPSGRWLLYPARDGEGPLDLWLLEVASGERRRLGWPASLTLKKWLPQLTPDETKLVWSPGRATRYPDSYRPGEACFYVQDLTSRGSRLVSLPEGATGRRWDMLPAALDNTFLYFVHDAKKLCRVRLDGTGLESLFPERMPMPR